MTTFGVDFHKHLDATQRDDIPLIMEKCIAEIDERCLQIRVCHYYNDYVISFIYIQCHREKSEAWGQEYELANESPLGKKT